MTRRGGLGRGLGALIPIAPEQERQQGDSPVIDSPTDRLAGEGVAEPPSAAGVDQSDPSSYPIVESPDGGPPDTETVPGTAAEQGWSGTGPAATYAEIPIAAIEPNPRQPRQAFDEEALTELTHSIREFGLLQPVVVRSRSDGGYELVMGERRWRAAQAAGLDVLPAIVRHTEDDDLLRDALLENVHRVDLNPLEEAAAYEQLLSEFGATHEQLATKLGRSRSQVTNTVRLLRLPVRVQSRVAAGVLSAGHARALLALEDPAAQEGLAGRIVAEGLSVRATEEIVAFGDTDGPTAARRTATRRPQSPALHELAAALGDAFDTRVKIDLGRRRGRITVEFGSLEDLERLVALIAPEVRTRADRDPTAKSSDG